MNEKPKTQKQIQKELDALKKQEQALLKEKNKLAQAEIDQQIEAVNTSLDTLIANEHDMSELRKDFSALLKKSYGKEYQIAVKKKPKVGRFNWADLADKMAKAGLTSKARAVTRKELEELYFGSGTKVFGQPFNDKEVKDQYLKTTGSAANMKYFV